MRSQDKWNKEHNYISKSFKMYKSLADEFKEACIKEGERQATVIQRLMTEYINKHKNKK